jgi:MFS family permease
VASDKSKRRLPVLQSTAPEDEENDARPAIHWVVLGAIATILGWLLLASVANWLLGALAAPPATPASVAVLVSVHAAAFGVASFAAGLLVGRFGTKAEPRHAMAAGGVAATLGIAMSASQADGLGGAAGALAWLLVLATLIALGAGAAFMGDRVGRRRRAR